jgi:hypothetical protein
LSYWGDKSLLPKSKLLAQFMARKDVLPLIRQLEFFDCIPKHPPKFIFMDSFSELTDQLFVNRTEGWRFSCGYSDIEQRGDFNTAYAEMGLMHTEDLQKNYEDLFRLFENRWGKVPIYFLHFPIALEKRDIFRTRYSAIMIALDTISESQEHIYSVKIDENKVTQPINLLDTLKDFPYHYDRNTYFEFAKLIHLN